MCDILARDKYEYRETLWMTDTQRYPKLQCNKANEGAL
jgi:hypothetical protein